MWEGWNGERAAFGGSSGGYLGCVGSQFRRLLLVLYEGGEAEDS